MPSLAFHSRLFALAAMLCTVIVLALVGTPDASGAPACKGAHARPGNASKRELVHATLCLLNSERAERGLRRLRLSRRLSRAARRHAMDMARRNYFSHTSLSGANFVERIRQTGYLSGATSWVVAENLAWGTGRSSSPSEAVQAWMGSPGHRSNILTARFRHAGIGIAFDSPLQGLRGATYASTFGAKR